MDKGKKSVTHHVGKLALEDGRFGGILYTSFPSHELLKMGKKVCLAIFMDKTHPAMAVARGPATLLEVIDTGDFLRSSGLKF